MQLTKYTHSCVRLDDGDRAVVIDPGVFSEFRAAIDGAQAVLITHEHPDHVDMESLRVALQRDSRLRVWAPASVADQLEQFGEQVTTVAAGQSFDAAGLAVRTFGGQHAVIHPSIPVIANVGYLVEDHVYHPGDSFIVPPVQVQTLLAPIHAPWSKISEVIDFVVAVRAPCAIGIHNALLNENGLGFVEAHVTRIGAEYEVQYSPMSSGRHCFGVTTPNRPDFC